MVWNVAGEFVSPKNNSWFEYAIWSFECHLPFVTLLDTDVVVPPPNVEFGKYECMDQVGNHLFDVWQWAVIFDGVPI